MNLTNKEALILIKNLEKYVSTIDKKTKVGDILNFKNLDWYVIEENGTETTLLLRDVLDKERIKVIHMMVL